MHHQRNPRDPAGNLRPEAVRSYGTMNTVKALEQLALAPQSAPELATALGVGVGCARRLLQRLHVEGYVFQEGGHRRRYHATLRLAVVGRQLLANAILPRLAGRWVPRLAQATACSAHLWVAAGEEALCVVHAAPAVEATPSAEPALCELTSDSGCAAAGVLSVTVRQASAYVRDGATAASAASVVQRGSIVAALGITGGHTVEALGVVVLASRALSQELDDELDRLRQTEHR